MSETMTKSTDYSTWYVKQQAAEAIGISTKQIDRWANDKRLQCGSSGSGQREGR